RHEGYLTIGNRRRIPAEHRVNVVPCHALAIFASQKILEQDSQREGKSRGLLTQRLQTLDDELGATDGELSPRCDPAPGARHGGRIYNASRSFHPGVFAGFSSGLGRARGAMGGKSCAYSGCFSRRSCSSSRCAPAIPSRVSATRSSSGGSPTRRPSPSSP